MCPNNTTIKRFIAGDASAFNEIYYAYSKKLYHFGLGLLKDPNEASELVQKVFVTVWIKRERVNPELNFENYLLTMAYNSIKKVFRHRAIEQKVKSNIGKASSGEINDTEDSVIFNDLLNLTQTSVEKMPPKRKKVYKLSREEGMNVKEIAEKLEISKRTVEGHLDKALQFLKEEMAKYSLPAILILQPFLL